MRQIALPLDWSAIGGGDLIVTPANEGVAGLIDNHSYWPHGGAILAGPPRSGKTLMAGHFERSHGGTAIDDADRLEDEALFHAWNAARTAGKPLLLTARTPPGDWGTALPDLRSRLAAMQLVELGEPDDALLEALLRLHLARLGTAATDETLAYVVKRIDRSYAATERFAHEANARALEQGGPVGMKLARTLFDHQNELDI